MREIVEVKTVIHCHGMTMEQAIAHAIKYLSSALSRVEIVAHDVFTEDNDG